MGRPKKSTKSTEPVQPEIQPEVVSEEKAELGETQPEIQLEMVIVPELDAPLEIPAVTPTEEIEAGTLDEVGTNSVMNLLTLETGEELYTVTKADLETNPDLAEQGVEEGEQIILGPVMSAEDIVLGAIDCSEEYVEINATLELLVNNPEDVQANRFIKKLLTGMVASGEIDVQNQVHLLLGSAYYKAGDPVTRYQTLRTVPVYAKKRQ
jgi:hypothetical protein